MGSLAEKAAAVTDAEKAALRWLVGGDRAFSWGEVKEALFDYYARARPARRRSETLSLRGVAGRMLRKLERKGYVDGDGVTRAGRRAAQ